MVVWRNFPSKCTSLYHHSPAIYRQKPVISPVFFDDIHHMFKMRRVVGQNRNRNFLFTLPFLQIDLNRL